MTLKDVFILILEIVGIENRRNTWKVSAHLLSKLEHSWGANIRGAVNFFTRRLLSSCYFEHRSSYDP